MSSLRPAYAAVAVLAVLVPASAAAQGRCGDHPWCNTALTPDQRADLLMAALTPDERVSLLAGATTCRVVSAGPGGA
jgi:beta-glucosidase